MYVHVYVHMCCAVLQELSGELEESEESSPEGALSKLTALIRVFTTVLMSLGTKFSPSRSVEINPVFVKEVSLCPSTISPLVSRLSGRSVGRLLGDRDGRKEDVR